MSDPTAPVTRDRETPMTLHQAVSFLRSVIASGERLSPEDNARLDAALRLAAPPAAPSEDAAWAEFTIDLTFVCRDFRADDVVTRHRPRIEAAIRAAHFAADPNTPAADCHNLTHRALDDARDELRAILAAAETP